MQSTFKQAVSNTVKNKSRKITQKENVYPPVSLQVCSVVDLFTSIRSLVKWKDEKYTVYLWLHKKLDGRTTRNHGRTKHKMAAEGHPRYFFSCLLRDLSWLNSFPYWSHSNLGISSYFPCDFITGQDLVRWSVSPLLCLWLFWQCGQSKFGHAPWCASLIHWLSRFPKNKWCRTVSVQVLEGSFSFWSQDPFGVWWSCGSWVQRCYWSHYKTICPDLYPQKLNWALHTMFRHPYPWTMDKGFSM